MCVGKKFFGLVTALLALATTALAGEQFVTLAKYRDDKPAAVSFTFDDGGQSQASIVAPLFEEFGYRASFYVIAGLTRDRPIDPPLSVRRDWAGASWEEWRALAKRGHEIGSHSWSHPKLINLHSDQELHHQLVDSARLIEKKIGLPALTVAFPYNQFNNRVREFARHQYIAAREHSCDYTPFAQSVETANAVVTRCIQTGNWLIPNLHSVAEGYGPVTASFLREHLEFIQQYNDQIWVDTFANVFRYQAQFKKARILVANVGSNQVAFTMTCTLDPATYNVPLTAVVHQPKAHAALAIRNGDLLPVVIASDKILVTAAPSPELIKVEWR